ncbi:unnamed protein product [Trichobilharzia szidati]|nr:unnamed protein product [Trichobilharzia szidati]
MSISSSVKLHYKRQSSSPKESDVVQSKTSVYKSSSTDDTTTILSDKQKLDRSSSPMGFRSAGTTNAAAAAAATTTNDVKQNQALRSKKSPIIIHEKNSDLKNFENNVPEPTSSRNAVITAGNSGNTKTTPPDNNIKTLSYGLPQAQPAPVYSCHCCPSFYAPIVNCVPPTFGLSHQFQMNPCCFYSNIPAYTHCIHAYNLLPYNCCHYRNSHSAQLINCACNPYSQCYSQRCFYTRPSQPSYLTMEIPRDD